jgi:hypothetical protein
MVTDSSERYVLLNRLADEFAERYRRGERPSLQEYIDLHPELADEIREFFPAMVDVEQVKEDHQAAGEEAAAPPLWLCSSSAISALSARSARAAWASSTRPSRSRWGGTSP